MAEITLDDIMKAPTDHDELAQHLLANGYIQPPPAPIEPTPTIAPATVQPMHPFAPKSEVSDMTPPNIEGTMPGAPSLALSKMEPINPARGEPIKKNAPLLFPASRPNLPAGNAIPNHTAPDLGTAAPGAASGMPKMTPPTIAPPTKEESIAAGKYEYNLNRPVVNMNDPIEKQEETRRLQIAYDREHPLGSDVSRMPGTKGKILHTLGEIGQIAGGAIAPGVVEQIPGTERNRQLQDTRLATDIREREQAANEKERTAEGTKNIESEIKNRESEMKQREEKNPQELIKDADNNVTGWKDKNGELHSMADAPDNIKQIAEDAQKAPKYETDKNSGNIVKLTTDKDGKTTSEVVYKGQPNVKTETRSIVGADGKAHDKVFDVTPGSVTFGKELADLGRAKEDKKESATAEIQKEKAGERVVLAYDKDNKAHLMSKADAEAEGMTHVTAASSGDIDKAKTHHVVLNTLQTQLNSVVNASKALDQNIVQRGIIARALEHPTNSLYDSAVRATIMAGASEPTKDYVQSVIALREAGLALPKEITGGSRVAEIQASALWATMPSAASLDSKYALKQSHKFQQDIDRLRQRAPLVRGLDIVDPDEAIKSKGTEKQHTVNAPAGGGAKDQPPGPPSAGMEWRRNKKTGEFRQFPVGQ